MSGVSEQKAKDARFTLRTSQEEMEALKAEAEARNVSLNTLIRGALRDYLHANFHSTERYLIDAVRKTPLGSCIRVEQAPFGQLCEVPAIIEYERDNPFTLVPEGGSIPPETPLEYMPIHLTQMSVRLSVPDGQSLANYMDECAADVGSSLLRLGMSGKALEKTWLQHLADMGCEKRLQNEDVVPDAAILQGLLLQLPDDYATGRTLAIMSPALYRSYRLNCIRQSQIPIPEVGEPLTKDFGSFTVSQSGQQLAVACEGMPTDAVLITNEDNLVMALSPASIQVIPDPDGRPAEQILMHFCAGAAVETKHAALLIRGFSASHKSDLKFA